MDKGLICNIVHVGVTVSDIDRSIAFYRDVLGLDFLGEMVMEGNETDVLFGRKNARARVAYLKGTDEVLSPAVELICFTGIDVERKKSDLFRTSISEICFATPDIDTVYHRLIDAGVECISAPQSFDFSEYGFGKSKAIYFRDPDGIILELSEA